MVSESILASLIGALATIAGVSLSFIFTILRTRAKGPELDYIDLTLDEFWGKLPTAVECLFEEYNRDKGDLVRKTFQEKTSNYIAFSTVIINTGDQPCYYRTVGMKLEVVLPSKPEESVYFDIFENVHERDTINSHEAFEALERRFITTKEREIEKYRILLPSRAKGWIACTLEIGGRYWDQKGRCYWIYSSFRFLNNGLIRYGGRRKVREPAYDITRLKLRKKERFSFLRKHLTSEEIDIRFRVWSMEMDRVEKKLIEK